jgi:hypothetical protein
MVLCVPLGFLLLPDQISNYLVVLWLALILLIGLSNTLKMKVGIILRLLTFFEPLYISGNAILQLFAGVLICVILPALPSLPDTRWSLALWYSFIHRLPLHLQNKARPSTGKKEGEERISKQETFRVITKAGKRSGLLRGETTIFGVFWRVFSRPKKSALAVLAEGLVHVSQPHPVTCIIREIGMNKGKALECYHRLAKEAKYM